MNHQAAFTQFFFDLEDPRQATKIAYPFFDVVFLTVCAAIGGAHGWEDIELFGEAHLEWLQRNGLFLKGLPVHDTIARIISRIQPEQFQNAFVRWMQATSERTDGELIAIDGKTLRSSYDRDSRQSTIHMVSAFAAENRLVLGQVKTDAKSNEITAIPELLALLDIKGCLVSIDAMGCQTEIASTIVKGGGDYLLAVKGNQPTLHHAVRAALVESTKKPLSEETFSVEKEHGRIDGREYHVLPAGALAEQFPEWKALKSIGVAISYRIENMEKFSMEYRYYISSAELTPEQFSSAVRGHWAIENSLHWVLDVVMNEDACQIYRGDAPQILACARHMAQNMLRAETSRKASLRKKQQFAGMCSTYLEKVLDAGLAKLNQI
ncbi:MULTISPECIES: ISAs1 family transposase [Aeromonas]|uniref:ISAs1 family transposase n=1 Tax=Aeromonas allosaccharophila TaxID=656 RepID=A0AAX3NYZ0_9GAMM|nr:ISAs1 family transposase [Aeromonas allosaccharophila]WED79346.1 ISAs1 family transposase [Aeromonas allosaccharophila]